MRILRLRLRNYRGVVDREIVPAPRGVTVLAGPNEIGKSSLAEAVDLLFDELDSTTRRRVRDVQPVDRDAAAEIEMDVESGPYAFTYAKRFQRRGVTRLTVTRPQVENWTGREAHRRARAILAETIDLELWRALRVQQGEGLAQASWQGHPALAAALDRAAGSADGALAETLFEKAEAECDRYFTRTGRERRELASAARAAERAGRAEEAAEQALAQLEDDVQRAAALRARRARLERTDREAEQALREAEATFEPIDALRELLATATARRDAALAEEREAVEAARRRSQLVAAHAAAETDLAQRSEEIESSEPPLLGARAELDHAERALREARATLASASRREATHRADLAFRRAERELEALRERGERLEQLRAERDAAARELNASPIDEPAVREIRDAERAVERARARVEAEGPLVQLTAHAPLRASLDGRSLSLDAGERVEQRVAESLWLSVPGLADVQVVAGAGAAARLKVLEEARTHWRERCAERDVDDHADAVRALTARRDAERRHAEAAGRLEALLREASQEELAARSEALAARIRAYPGERAGKRAGKRADERASERAGEGTSDLPLPSDVAQAEACLAAAEEALAAASRATADLERRREGLLERHRQLAEHHHETAVRLELAEQSFRDLDARLVRARSEASDEALCQRRDTCCERARAASGELREAQRRLAEAAPQQAEARLARAREAREGASRELARLRDEAARVAARLEVRGEAGLYEQLEEARAESHRCVREQQGLLRRARAARLLRDTLREERECARQRYAEPLERRIEELGRAVFGEGFHVTLDDELRVARRVQDGVSLAFDQLSAGAREQIALIERLAVATLVGADGGAPLVLDDALGHSDAQRLAGIGRILSRVGAACQILVLTCTPERYRHVEAARLLTLG